MTKEEYFGIVDKEIERLKDESEYYKILATVVKIVNKMLLW